MTHQFNQCRAPACGYLLKGETLCPEHREMWRQLLDEWTAEIDTNNPEKETS